MNFNEKHFDIAAAQLSQRREKNSLTERERHRQVCLKLPEYAQLEDKLAETSTELIRMMLAETGDRTKMLEQIRNNNLSLQKQMADLLEEGGFPPDFLKPIYNCPFCKDKGTVDGRWCECFNRLMMSAAAEELNAVSPLKLSSFDSFKLEYYSDQKDEKLGVSPREIMARNLTFCRSYAENFTKDSDSVFLNGGTGLGKTHLSLAIADEVIKRGFTAIYGSAPELLREIEKQYFGREDGDTMASLSKCDLLILDDLGAESEKSLYTSLLYELINARISRGLPTIINSNCSASELKQRYQDRIWSRIFSFEVLVFLGTDIRRMLKK